ncbi:hypothetical protein RFI_02319 [Reticulomyxa filosa]|uniref:Uncharacterized protein n=1 Tax=Reticulomyxa filosa TaxID=46433 RepID=X6P896_RETFI|nr:hypothetical protein RFI_02319 [Reticulomyxa filosa]|eukprot:ETO34770.1 hypothetical protein RFI_02319 [Reticulomyxa filosa]
MTLQVGNPKKSSLEVHAHIQWYNDFDDIEANCIKWTCLILNNSWHFRTNDSFEMKYLSNFCAEFNSCNVTWKDDFIYKFPLNPYVATFENAKEYLKDKLEIIEYLGNETGKLTSCNFSKSGLSTVFAADRKGLLHNECKHIPHYPSIQVHLKLAYKCIVPYERTIGTEGYSMLKIIFNENIDIPAIEKPGFHPFLYKRDTAKLYFIPDNLYATQRSIKNNLKHLLHEVISNGYLCDQNITNLQEEKKAIHENIKQQIYRVKQVYRSDVHRCMGYSLELHHICAILLYCGKSCSAEFSYDQMDLKHNMWAAICKVLLRYYPNTKDEKKAAWACIVS